MTAPRARMGVSGEVPHSCRRLHRHRRHRHRHHLFSELASGKAKNDMEIGIGTSTRRGCERIRRDERCETHGEGTQRGMKWK